MWGTVWALKSSQLTVTVFTLTILPWQPKIQEVVLRNLHFHAYMWCQWRPCWFHATWKCIYSLSQWISIIISHRSVIYLFIIFWGLFSTLELLQWVSKCALKLRRATVTINAVYKLLMSPLNMCIQHLGGKTRFKTLVTLAAMLAWLAQSWFCLLCRRNSTVFGLN